jgi:hypothetical protein
LFQRKLAVMAKCSAITPDKKHPAHGFDYVSIQNVSNHLRRVLVEEGLDVSEDVIDGEVLIHLTNADNPDDHITSRWPVVAGDKGFAFSVKFPLMRLFLVGDGEENDEAEMADRSAATPNHTPQRPQERTTAPAPRTAPQAGTTKPLGPCPDCAEEGITAASGKPAMYWPPRKAGMRPQCNGIQDGVYLNHQMSPEPQLTGVGAAVRDAADQVPMEAYDDGSIPF